MKAFFLGHGLLDPLDLITGNVILCPEALAAGLNGSSRFSNQTHHDPISTLLHSIRVGEEAARFVNKLGSINGDNKEDKFLTEACYLWGLLHDAPEVPFADIIKPVKLLPEMAGYRELESKLDVAYQKHYLPALWSDKDPGKAQELRDLVDNCVKVADMVCLGIESLMVLPMEGHENAKEALPPPVVDEFHAEVLRILKSGDTLDKAYRWPGHWPIEAYFCDYVRNTADRVAKLGAEIGL